MGTAACEGSSLWPAKIEKKRTGAWSRLCAARDASASCRASPRDCTSDMASQTRSKSSRREMFFRITGCWMEKSRSRSLPEEMETNIRDGAGGHAQGLLAASSRGRYARQPTSARQCPTTAAEGIRLSSCTRPHHHTQNRIGQRARTHHDRRVRLAALALVCVVARVVRVCHLLPVNVHIAYRVSVIAGQASRARDSVAQRNHGSALGRPDSLLATATLPPTSASAKDCICRPISSRSCPFGR